MAEPSVLIRDFNDFNGLDYRRNNITRKETFARESNNAHLSPRGDLIMRPGRKPFAWVPTSYQNQNGVSRGVWIWKNNVLEAETLLYSLYTSLYRLKHNNVTIGYVGIGNGTFKLIPVLTAGVYSYRCICTANGVEVLNVDLGNLLTPNLAAFYTLATLVAAINGLADFTCTYGGGTEVNTIAAAHLPLTALLTIAAGAIVTVEASYLEIVPTSVIGGGASFSQNLEWDDQPPTQRYPAGLDCNTHFEWGLIGRLLKYDGACFYQAALPYADLGATYFRGAPVAGGVLVGDYYWSMAYQMEDANRNIIEGNTSDDVNIVLGGANQQADITMPAVDACRANLTFEGWMKNYAYVNGAQVGVNVITVDNGAGGDHYIQVGQRAIFYNSVGALQNRTVTARTGTTITIDGAVVTVANNEFISSGMTINLYRNKVGGIRKYLVRQFTEAAVGITYRDNIPDANLGYEYVPPFEVLGHGPDVGLYTDSTKYVWDGVCFGVRFKGITVWVSPTGRVQFSDPDGPEYFVTGGSSFTLLSKSTSPVRGIGANDEAIFIFKEDEIVIVRGELTTGRWTQEAVGGIGCDSHETIVTIHGYVWFWSRAYGLCRIRSNIWPEQCSYRIDTYIQSLDFNNDGAMFPNFARGHYDEKLQRYFLQIPALSKVDMGFGSFEAQPNYANSKLYLCDVSDADFQEADVDSSGQTQEVLPKTRWWRLTGMNMLGGATRYRGKFVFPQTMETNIAGYHVSQLCEELQNGNVYDYTDQAQPITFEYEHGWIYLDEPSTLKKWLRSELYSFRNGLANQTAFTILASLEIRYKDGQTWSSQTLDFAYDPASSVDVIEQIFEFMPIDTKAVKLKLSGTYFCQCPLISGWMTEAVPPFSDRIQS